MIHGQPGSPQPCPLHIALKTFALAFVSPDAWSVDKDFVEKEALLSSSESKHPPTGRSERGGQLLN